MLYIKHDTMFQINHVVQSRKCVAGRIYVRNLATIRYKGFRDQDGTGVKTWHKIMSIYILQYGESKPLLSQKYC